MKRLVQPEWLDTLPPDDPRAVHSRRDLRRVNTWMGSRRLLAQALIKDGPGDPPRHLTELGAGDGTFLLGLAQILAPRWPGLEVTLLDLHENVSSRTLDAFADLGWRAKVVVADVFDWPDRAGDQAGEAVIANLFLHHFENARLAALLQQVSLRAGYFVALEPRRAAWPLFCSRWLGAIGCNAVTRHDAVVSVRAGFSGHEISGLWPDPSGWELAERPAGSFSHLFSARKTK